MGVGMAREEGRHAAEEFRDPRKVDEELARLKNYWHGRIAGLEVETPDAEFNSMLNMWGPFNCLMTYAWSRAASLIYAGERDGLGYRDTVQDMLGVMHAIPAEAVKRLELMITGQVSTGGAMPVVKQFAHQPWVGGRAARGRVPFRRLPVAVQCDPRLRQGDRRSLFLSQGSSLCRQGRGQRARPHEASHRIQPEALRQPRPAVRLVRRLERLHSPGRQGRVLIRGFPAALCSRHL